LNDYIIAPADLADRDWTLQVETIDLSQQMTTTPNGREAEASNNIQRVVERVNRLHDKNADEDEEEQFDLNRDLQRFVAEILHITRPTIHRILLSMIIFPFVINDSIIHSYFCINLKLCPCFCLTQTLGNSS
jgi:hypothetical protein